MIGDAIAHYHDLLQGPLAQETHEALAAELEKRGLYFGKLPVCRVLRPHFYVTDDWEYLRRETEKVLRAFRKLHEACMRDYKLRAQLSLEPFEEELFALDKGMTAPWSSSRLDAFFRPEDRYLRFVEYNAETPAGIGYGDELAEAFLSLEVTKRFQQRYAISYSTGLPQLLDVLLRAYREWGGTEPPQIAIIDWQDVPTLREHVITCEYFIRNGYKCKMADPRELEYHDGFLWLDDFRVDAIYKRVLYSELVARAGLNSDVIRAIRDRNVFITNAPSAKLMAKKASLALLSDEKNRNLFSEEEWFAIQLHVPWTRRVAERTTYYEGQEIDLVEYVAENQSQFVLKPNDDYGGQGVVIGWEVSTDEWEAALRHALNVPFVVQERVTLVERDYPMMIDGKLDISPRYVDANPYVFYGDHVGGCLTRLSDATLLNVTAGSGSVVPMFVLSERPGL